MLSPNCGCSILIYFSLALEINLNLQCSKIIFTLAKDFLYDNCLIISGPLMVDVSNLKLGL